MEGLAELYVTEIEPKRSGLSGVPFDADFARFEQARDYPSPSKLRLTDLLLTHCRSTTSSRTSSRSCRTRATFVLNA